MRHWHDAYEDAAEAEARRWREASDAALLGAIRAGQTGDYFTLWTEASRRPRTPALCWALFDVLTRPARPYLERYHAAAALLELLGSTVFEAVELSAPWPEVPANLQRMQAIVTETVGPPG